MFPPRLSSGRHCVENMMLLHIEIFCRISIKMPGLQDFGVDNLSFTFYSLNGHGGQSGYLFHSVYIRAVCIYWGNSLLHINVQVDVWRIVPGKTLSLFLSFLQSLKWKPPLFLGILSCSSLSIMLDFSRLNSMLFKDQPFTSHILFLIQFNFFPYNFLLELRGALFNF